MLVFYYCIGKKTAHSGVVKKSRTEHFCSIRLGTGVFEELPWVETMMKGAHHLPEYTFMYLTSNSKINGRTTPPMIIEKDRVNFFVKPKVNEGAK